MHKIKIFIKNIVRLILLFLSYFLNKKIGFITNSITLSKNEIHDLSSASEVDLKKYEDLFAQNIGEGEVVSFASGRMALYVILKAVGINPGDEVLLTGFTCAVVVNAILRLKAVPIYVDINLNDFGTCPTDFQNKISSKTKAIVVQHTFGIPCQIEEIMNIAKSKNIFVIEDCALSFGTKLKGKFLGDFGDASFFSSDHTKPINTLIGGYAYSKDKSLMEQIKQINMSCPHLPEEHQHEIKKYLVFESSQLNSNRYMAINRFIRLQQIWGHITPFLIDDFSCTSENKIYSYPSKLPHFLALVGLKYLENFDEFKKARENLLKDYIKVMIDFGFEKYIPDCYFNYSDIVPLRFVFVYPMSFKEQRYLNRILFKDYIWFKSPIVCTVGDIQNYKYKQGGCLAAEEIGKNIINFPCCVNESEREFIINSFREFISYLTKNSKI